MELVNRLLAGSRRAAAKLITEIENETLLGREALKCLYPYTGKAYTVGITGPPGAGKSTLTDKLTKGFRLQGKTVGIIAVDPTSPFTGGAILGDRVRMQDLATDEGVFIRSMGTRGSLGGIASKTNDAVKVLDAFGKDVILIETVGVGQAEVDIVRLTDTTVVTLVPGLGDDIQAIKAGILEIGDIFVINKADRDGAERLFLEIGMMLELDNRQKTWQQPVLKTIAPTNTGIEELLHAIDQHWQYLNNTGELTKRRAERCQYEILTMVKEKTDKYITMKLKSHQEFSQMIERVIAKEIDPYQVVDKILEPLTSYWDKNMVEEVNYGNKKN